MVYRHAAQKSPERFGYCLGVSLIALQRYEEALPWVLAAAEKHEPDALSWFQVALCHEKMGHRTNAETAYEKAIDLDAEYAKPWFNLGGLYWNDGETQKAKAIWERAVTKFPEHELVKQVKRIFGKDM